MRVWLNISRDDKISLNRLTNQYWTLISYEYEFDDSRHNGNVWKSGRGYVWLLWKSRMSLRIVDCFHLVGWRRLPVDADATSLFCSLFWSRASRIFPWLSLWENSSRLGRKAESRKAKVSNWNSYWWSGNGRQFGLFYYHSDSENICFSVFCLFICFLLSVKPSSKEINILVEKEKSRSQLKFMLVVEW